MLNLFRWRSKTPSPLVREGRGEGTSPSIIPISRWPALIAVAALAATAIILSAIPSGPAAPPAAAQSPPDCQLELDQDDETGAGNTIDLQLTFLRCSTTAQAAGSLTIKLPKEMDISDFNKDDVAIYADKRYQPQWVNVGSGEDDSHEIEILGCPNWRDYSDDAPSDCSTPLTDVRITLRNLRLPVKPPPDDGYIVSVMWAGIEGDNALKHDLDVTPSLQANDDGETVRYGQTVTFTAAGFNSDLTARLYASRGNDSDDCKSISDWRQIATAEVGSNYRFTADIEIAQAQFPAAGRHQVCAADGAGLQADKPVTITVAAGVTLAGSREVSPGDDVFLRLVGNPGHVQSVSVGGLDATIKSQSGSTLTITIPPRVTGIATIRVNFADGSSAFVNVTVADATLTVAGIHGAGIGLGETAFVSAFDLPGDEVCTVTLGGVPIALLDDRRDIPDGGCIEIRPGGRFNATVLLADPNGALTSQVIGKVVTLKPGDKLKLEVTDDIGVKASALVPVAIPEITFEPPDGVIERGQPVIVRGHNFPPDRPDYYQVPPVTIKVAGRQVGNVYPTGAGSWEYEYRHTDRHQPGESVSIDVSLDQYPLSSLIPHLRIKISPVTIGVNPNRAKINTPITVAVSGLEPHTVGYGIKIRNGPYFSFNGISSFQSDRSGHFNGTTRFPEYDPLSFDRRGEATIFLELHDRYGLVTGVHATLTLQQGYHPTPTPTPTNTPTPTPTPTPTSTPTPTPTNTPTPAPTPTPTATPTPTPTNIPTPTPIPTDTPLPPATIDRSAISATVVAAIAPPADAPPGSGGGGGQGIGDVNPAVLISLLAGAGAVVILFGIALFVRMLVRRWSRAPLFGGPDGYTLTIDDDSE